MSISINEPVTDTYHESEYDCLENAELQLRATLTAPAFGGTIECMICPVCQREFEQDYDAEGNPIGMLEHVEY